MAARPIMIFAIVSIGLHLVTGLTGLLNLGIAGFMAIGAYSYAIVTADIYPFQFGFIGGILVAVFFGALAGIALGIPTLHLRGDYLAVVTLGFGEIVQDTLRNIEVITKGSQGINPLPGPSILGFSAPQSWALMTWYYLLLVILVILVVACIALGRSKRGLRWRAVRADQLASECMGIDATTVKLQAFACSAAVASLGGALWASYLGSTGEPGNFDFQISVMILCIVIVGGLGNIYGALLGAVLMVGMNSVVLVKLASFAADLGFTASDSVFLVPSNWKYLLFGLTLILITRYRPQGLLPAQGAE